MPADPTAAPLLSETQRRIVGFALTLLALFASLALIVAAFAGFGALLGFFSSVIWPLAVAGVLALILRPVVDWLERRMRLRRLAAVILLYGAVLLLISGALLLILPPLIDQTLEFIAYVPTLWENVTTYVQQHYPAWMETVRGQLERRGLPSISEMIGTETKALLAQTVPSLRMAFGGLLNVVGFLTHVVIIPVYLFFFLLMRGEPTQHLGSHLPFLRPSVRDDVVFLANEFVGIIESFFRGQLLIGLCMGLLYAAGFTIVGLKFGLFIGLALGFLNIIPYLGTILGLATTLPLAFFQPDGGLQLVGWVIGVTLIVQAIESWVLTPKIMGDQTGLHPAAIIFAVFFWGTAFHGVLGMLLAVPLTAFFVTAWRLAKRKYFRADA
ncbi:AI-2E family transporter [Opitutus sp. ER46]|uniref:AI-2E family transporter n=1 Tax=Opitutus sp. ER46 TaxID=2161864 RepID=UPI000D30A68E|nr:AI-2E family transporter [Opitutus sp. ER46]PTX94306.1 AI-2E family transporter [Opitutus sp. ER46]